MRSAGLDEAQAGIKIAGRNINNLRYAEEREYIKAVYCHPAYLTYMQSTSCEMLGWMNHKLQSRLPGEIATTFDMQMVLL